MSAVGAHPNITLWTYSEVTKMDGYVGNYTVTVKRKPRYINEDLCTGCQECIAQLRLSRSRSSRMSSTRAWASASRSISRSRRPRPQVVLIDPEVCLNFKRGVAHRQVQEDLRRGLRREEGDRLHAEGGDRGDQGRHHHRGHRLPDLRRQAHSAVRLRHLPERLYRAGSRAPGQCLRPDRRRGGPARRQAPESPSASSTASARATRRPTAGARASAACIR